MKKLVVILALSVSALIWPGVHVPAQTASGPGFSVVGVSQALAADPDQKEGNYDSKGRVDCPKGYIPLSSAFSSNGKPLCIKEKGSANPIYLLIRDIVRVLSGLFGLVLVLILVVAGFQYVISNGSPDDTKAAKERIKAAVTGFVLYILMIGILQLLLPENTKLFGG